MVCLYVALTLTRFQDGIHGRNSLHRRVMLHQGRDQQLRHGLGARPMGGAEYADVCQWDCGLVLLCDCGARIPVQHASPVGLYTAPVHR